MARRIALTAQRSLSYQGRPIIRGEVFEASVAHAIVLARRGEAISESRSVTVETREIVPEPPVVEPEPEPEPANRRRRYRRRDLTADLA